MNETRPTAPRSFVTLDGLRGVAALAIAIRHAPFLWDRGYPSSFLQESYLAVDFFFVLSGFVLAHAYGERLRNGLGLRQFIRLRLIRFSPLYWLSILIGFAATAGGFLALGLGWSWLPGASRDLVFGLMWIPTAFNPAALFPLNSPAWSLFQELIVNSLLVLTGSSLRRCLPLAVVAGIGLAASVGLGWFGFGGASGSLDAGSGWSSFPAGVLRALYSFFAGVVTYRLWLIRPPRAVFSPLLPALLLCAVLILPAPSAGRGLYDLALSLVLFPILVHVAAGSDPAPALAGLFAWLGRVSYGVYVLQMPLYTALTYLAKAMAGAAALARYAPIFAGSSVCVVVMAATLLDRSYDRPFRRWLSGRRP